MSEIQSSIVPWSELAREGHLPRLLVLCFGIWLYAADSTLVATVMPAAVEEIGGLPYLSWTYTLYQLGSIVIPVPSWLAWTNNPQISNRVWITIQKKAKNREQETRG